MSEPTSAQSLSDAFASIVAAAGEHLLPVRAGRRQATGTSVGDGFIVTTARVLHRHAAAEVLVDGGRPIAAEVVGRDPATDLALLRVDPATTPPAPEWAPASDVRVGHLVVAVGRSGERLRATLGLVSGTGGPWRTSLGAHVDAWIDVDGHLPRGFSGGPLVAADGRFVGVNTRAIVRGGTTLPMATLLRTVEALKTGGAVKRGYLGVGVQAARLPAAAAEATGRAAGLVVTAIEPDSPAERAGILLGDTLLAVDGTPLTRLDDLLAALATSAGKEIALELLRGGVVHTLAATAGERPARFHGRGPGFGRGHGFGHGHGHGPGGGHGHGHGHGHGPGGGHGHGPGHGPGHGGGHGPTEPDDSTT